MKNTCIFVFCCAFLFPELVGASVLGRRAELSVAVPDVSSVTAPIVNLWNDGWRAVSSVADQGGRLLDQSLQTIREYGGAGSQYVGEKVRDGGRYVEAEIDAGLKGAMRYGFSGLQYVGDRVNEGVQTGSQLVKEGTAKGLRGSASALSTLGGYRKASLDGLAYFTNVGIQKANEFLDHVNSFSRKELNEMADVVQNPGAFLRLNG